MRATLSTWPLAIVRKPLGPAPPAAENDASLDTSLPLAIEILGSEVPWFKE